MAWDEARELIAAVLVACAVAYVVAPVLQQFGAASGIDSWSDVANTLRGVNVSSGLLIVAAAVVVGTTPSADVVPLLRSAVTAVAVLMAVAGAVAVLIEISGPSVNTGHVLDRLGVVFGRSGPGTLLAATAAWTARRVVPFGGGPPPV